MKKLHKPTERVLDILLLLSKSKHGLNLTEISEQTNIPKSTISPILKTMVEMKFTSLDVNNKYTIGINSYKVGQSFEDSFDFLEVIKQYMKKIVNECNEICQIGIYNDGDVVYISKEEPSQSIKLISSVGKAIPAYSTALGKSLLSQFTDEEIKEVYKNGLKSITVHTITNIDTLLKDIQNVRKYGYSYENSESTLDVECIAVPLYNNNNLFASISISIPSFRASEEKNNQIIELLIDYKEKIEAAVDDKKVNLSLETILSE